MEIKKLIVHIINVLLCIALINAGVIVYAKDDEDYDIAQKSTADIIERGLQNFIQQNTYTYGQFADVLSSSWYAENVKIAYDLGLVRGSSDTTFNPTGNLTVAETITLAVRLHSIYYSGVDDFVQIGTWYQVYVDYALTFDIINEGQFNNFTKAATRAEFAQIFSKSLPSEAMEIINWVEDEAIPDVKVSVSYGSAVYMLYRVGILAGSDKSGTFNPTSTITRAEAAAIVTRMAYPKLRQSVTLSV